MDQIKAYVSNDSNPRNKAKTEVLVCSVSFSLNTRVLNIAYIALTSFPFLEIKVSKVIVQNKEYTNKLS